MYVGLTALLLSVGVVAQQAPPGPTQTVPPDDSQAVKQEAPKVSAAVKAPALTTEQKQGLQLVLQRLENAQLRAQLAGQDFERARGDLGALVQALQVPGYELNLQTLEYSKKAEPPKPEPKADAKEPVKK